MKRLLLSVFAVVLTSFMGLTEVEAKRMGGGRSVGIQRTPITQPARQTASPQAPTAAPTQQARPQTTPATSGWRRWVGPLAGLAAGIGLASLFSHFGMGADLAGLMLALLLGVVAFVVIRRLMAGKSRAAAGPQYAGAGAPYSMRETTRESGPSLPASPAPNSVAAMASSPAGRIPPGFDVEGFVRAAKVSFIRLQAAYDAGDLADIREFTSPEMFAEIRMDLEARGSAANKTEVMQLDAELLDVSEEGARYLASLRFHGLLREDGVAGPFNEVWHLAKPIDGGRGWVLAGIEQLQ